MTFLSKKFSSTMEVTKKIKFAIFFGFYDMKTSLHFEIKSLNINPMSILPIQLTDLKKSSRICARPLILYTLLFPMMVKSLVM